MTRFVVASSDADMLLPPLRTGSRAPLWRSLVPFAPLPPLLALPVRPTPPLRSCSSYRVPRARSLLRSFCARRLVVLVFFVVRTAAPLCLSFPGRLWSSTLCALSPPSWWCRLDVVLGLRSRFRAFVVRRSVVSRLSSPAVSHSFTFHAPAAAPCPPCAPLCLLHACVDCGPIAALRRGHVTIRRSRWRPALLPSHRCCLLSRLPASLPVRLLAYTHTSGSMAAEPHQHHGRTRDCGVTLATIEANRRHFGGIGACDLLRRQASHSRPRHRYALLTRRRGMGLPGPLLPDRQGGGHLLSRRDFYYLEDPEQPPDAKETIAGRQQ